MVKIFLKSQNEKEYLEKFCYHFTTLKISGPFHLNIEPRNHLRNPSHQELDYELKSSVVQTILEHHCPQK